LVAPGFAPVILDLAELSDQEVELMALSALSRLVALLLKHIRDGSIAERLPRWAGSGCGPPLHRAPLR
jgi:hypothetical protein